MENVWWLGMFWNLLWTKDLFAEISLIKAKLFWDSSKGPKFNKLSAIYNATEHKQNCVARLDSHIIIYYAENRGVIKMSITFHLHGLNL